MAKILELITLLAFCLSYVWSLDICEDQVDGARLLYPTDCTKYIICSFGQTYAIESCEEGKHFNRLTSQCDEPITAACDVEVIKYVIADSQECNSCRAACRCLSEPDSTTQTLPTVSPASSTPAIPTPAPPVSTTPASPTSGSSTPVSPTPAPTTPGSSAPVSSTPASPNPGSTPVSSTAASPTPGSTPVSSTAASPTPASPTPVSSTPASPTLGSSTTVSPNPVSSTPGSSTPVSSTPASPTPDSSTPVSPAPGSSTSPSPSTDLPLPSPPSTPVSPSSTSPTPTANTNTPCSNDLTICIGQPDESSVYVPNSCHEYAICISGCAHVLSCPNNLLYDISSHSCTYPENVNCPYPSEKPSGPSAGPSGTKCEQPGKCENQPDGTLFADDASNGYIICQCECEIARPCPGDLIFHESLQVCDFPPKNEY